MKRSLIHMSAVLAVLLPVPALIAAPPVNEESVTRAIEQGVKYLFSLANAEGIWDSGPPPKPPERITDKDGPADREYVYGGRTALVLNALATAGQESDPRFQKALAWLMKQELHGTYAIGLRMHLIHNLRRPADYLAVLRRDGATLLKGIKATGGGAMWTYSVVPYPYSGTTCIGDFSCTNYAVLGLWAACDERQEIPSSVWLRIEQAWVRGQQKNGAWSYFPAPDLTPRASAHAAAKTGSLTTAALASLYLVIDECYAGQGELGRFRSSPSYKAIQSGLKWMETEFSATANPGWGEWATYYFYNCERVAAAGGLKYFGKHDWFRGIAATILGAQRADGAVALGGPANYGGALIDTSFALLFLAKGSAPVVLNKLQHAGDWDNRLREVAALTEWLARHFERPANWQVVDLQSAAEALTDSRTLYIAGTKPLSFSAEEKARLKRYVELGGLLVFHPDSADGKFAASAKKLLSEIWPALEVTMADLKQPAFEAAFAPALAVNKKLRLEMLASSTRVLAFLLQDSPAAAWERREYTTRKDQFELGAALYAYATDLARFKDLPTKLTLFGEPFRSDPPATTKTVKLARIRYGDNPHRWDPEPLAFERFARLLAEREKVRCEIQVVAPAELAASGAAFAHLTGVDDLGLTQKESDALAAFVKAGGVLIADQAGGPPRGPRKAAFDALRRMTDAWFGAGSLKPMTLREPVLGGMEKAVYRNFAGVRREKRPLVLDHVVHGGRVAVIYSPHDLTCGLLDCPNPMTSGPVPEACYELLAHILAAKPAAAAQP